MQTRRHDSGAAASEATYSDCGTYRYRLARRWGAGEGLLYVLLNPSTATEMQNDPTLERCERRARALGFGGFEVVNLFAYRATRPADLRRADDPIGPGNDDMLLRAARGADSILCGWGVHGALLGRGAAVAAMLRGAGCDLWHLGTTRDGAPRHPLYVAYARKPCLWA